MTRIVRAAIVPCILVASIQVASPASAGAEDSPENYRTLWRPNQVTVTTYKLGALNHRVVESFSWTTEWSLRRVACPRVDPCNRGIWEQELRFNHNQGESSNHWCSANHNPWDVNTFLPSPDGAGGYRDVLPTGDEFTWGFHTDQINEDWIYSIDFKCRPDSSSNVATRYTSTGQLGHCHPIPTCSQFNTFADETVTLIPRRKTNAPDSNFAPVTFDENPGFEGGWGPWNMQNERSGSGLVCNNPNPYQGQCYVFINPKQGVSGRLQYNLDVNPPTLAQAGSYSEFWARCPSAWNPNNCHLRLVVQARDSQGTVIDSVNGEWVLFEKDDQWQRLRVVVSNSGSPNEQWPVETRSWRFRIEGQSNDAFDADLHQQGYKTGVE